MTAAVTAPRKSYGLQTAVVGLNWNANWKCQERRLWKYSLQKSHQVFVKLNKSVSCPHCMGLLLAVPRARGLFFAGTGRQRVSRSSLARRLAPLDPSADLLTLLAKLGISRFPLFQLCCRKPKLPAHGQPARQGCVLPTTPAQQPSDPPHSPGDSSGLKHWSKLVCPYETFPMNLQFPMEDQSFSKFPWLHPSEDPLHGGMNGRRKASVILQRQRATLPKEHLLNPGELAHRNPVHRELQKTAILWQLRLRISSLNRKKN